MSPVARSASPTTATAALPARAAAAAAPCWPPDVATMSARLSIVMPALNEAARIGASLQALAPLRRRGVEVVVVDGGSSDGTAALAEPWADHVLSSPRGRARQMNAGAAQSRADA